MVRTIKTMYETSRIGSAALGGWMAVWILSLGLLAAMPQSGSATQGSGTGVYYDYGSTNYQYQDLTGTYSVPARTLRPIYNG